ncbi:MAG: hypothetical protein AAFZ18_08225 [Myxococcota bacterium]
MLKRYLRTSLLLLTAGAGLSCVTSCDAPCSADCGSLGPQLACYSVTQTCRPLCASSLDCEEGRTCVEQPSGESVCGDIAFGGEGEACFADQTCDWGFECNTDAGVCENRDGQREGRCRPNDACDQGLECVEGFCRLEDLGGIGETCYAPDPRNPNQALCQDVTAICELGICRGGAGDVCDLRARPCRRGFLCDMPENAESGDCIPEDTADAGVDDMGAADAEVEADAGEADLGPVPCMSRSDCAAGEFCCGETGTQYSGGLCSGLNGPAASGQCFAAPDAYTEEACAAHTECPDAPPVPSGTSTAASMCMPWGENDSGLCSVPCQADAGCPAKWSCEPHFVPCFDDEACGGAECVGAFPDLRQAGRCRCDPGLLGACTSTAGPGQGICAPDGVDFSCKLTDHCAPPRP